MTLFKPTLILNRLVILKSGGALYDEKFHKGVNIIRGENGSGKTTIIQAIVHVLGGDVNPKKDELKLCDFICAEVEINGGIYTFRREVGEDGTFPSIEIHEGSYETSWKDVDNWARFPNRRSSERKSYSEAIFGLLGLPEEKVDNASNITIHDVLRLVYEDQLTSADKIFQPPKFPEGNNRRQAISDLLLGIDDLELHRLRNELNESEREWSGYEGQLKQIVRVLGSADMALGLAAVKKERSDLENELKDLYIKIDSIYAQDKEKNNAQAVKKEAKKDFKTIKAEIVNLRKTISHLESEKNSLAFEIEDSREFLLSLQVRLDALHASTEVTKALGGIEYNYCPSCLQIIEEEENHQKCSLCKSDIKEDGRSLGYLKIKNEIHFQKRESEGIVERKEKRIAEIDIALASLNSELAQYERKNKIFIQSLNPLEAEARSLIEKTGYIKRAIQDTFDKETLAQKIQDIRTRKEAVAARIEKLKGDISIAMSLREKKRLEVYEAINDKTLLILKKDPNPELSKVDRISFDFGKDEVIAVGKSSPAASTNTYLKNSFFFALFLVSLEKRFVRYPRFIIMDNIEDSGLSTSRAQQFHADIIAQSKNTDVDHQIIFTARSEVISLELDESDLCVGDHYDDVDGERSLRFSTRKLGAAKRKKSDLNAFKRHSELLNQIKTWDSAYYLEDKPIVNDAAYDQAKRELEAIETKYPELKPDVP